MVHARMDLRKCPACTLPYDAAFFGVRSWLGPPQGECARCGGTIATGRSEWPEMPPWRKLRYVALSAFYAAGFALVGAQLLWPRQLHPEAAGETIPYDQPGYRQVAWGCAGLVVLVQLLRVIRSPTRGQLTPGVLPKIHSIFGPGLDFAMQLKLVVLAAAAYFLFDCLR